MIFSHKINIKTYKTVYKIRNIAGQHEKQPFQYGGFVNIYGTQQGHEKYQEREKRQQHTVC